MQRIQFTVAPVESHEAFDAVWRKDKKRSLPDWGNLLVTGFGVIFWFWRSWIDFPHGMYWLIATELISCGCFLGWTLANLRVVYVKGKMARRLHRQLWDKPVTIEITDTSIAISSGESRETHALSRFVRAVELKRVFLLYASEDVWTLIPKRAFATDTEAAQFLGHVTQGIAAGIENANLNRGFQVVDRQPKSA